jgi:hypothetical protein
VFVREQRLVDAPKSRDATHESARPHSCTPEPGGCLCRSWGTQHCRRQLAHATCYGGACLLQSVGHVRINHPQILVVKLNRLNMVRGPFRVDDQDPLLGRTMSLRRQIAIGQLPLAWPRGCIRERVERKDRTRLAQAALNRRCGGFERLNVSLIDPRTDSPLLREHADQAPHRLAVQAAVTDEDVEGHQRQRYRSASLNGRVDAGLAAGGAAVPRIIQDMVGSIFPRVEEATFVEVLLSDERRRALLEYLGSNAPHARSIPALISVVAPKCRATPEQLSEAIGVLRAEGSPEAGQVLRDLLFHPDVPEDLLLQLAGEDEFISVLGHRAGPRRLLELLAEKPRYPEAITTLALHHFGAKDAPDKPFREFLLRYRDVDMLEYNLVRAKGLSDAKRGIVREIFGDDPDVSPVRGKRRRR